MIHVKPNRYASILENTVGFQLDELIELNVEQGHWSIREGKLCLEQGKDLFEFEFEQGDPTSTAIVLMLNMLPNLITVLRRNTQCT